MVSHEQQSERDKRSEEMLREFDREQPFHTSALIATVFDGLSSTELNAATSFAHG